MQQIKIGIIGDFNPDFPPHSQTDTSLVHTASALGIHIDSQWLPTDASHEYSNFHALWCSPGSPYQSLEGALHGIRYAREQMLPLLGTCGGCQHIVLEYARNVIGIEDAAHAEYDPYASRLFIQPLSCSLKGKVLPIEVLPNSLAARSYGRLTSEERYYCDFGLNPAYQDELQKAGLLITGWDPSQEARIVEIQNHPFYLATLFVPQSASRMDQPHPLIRAFVQAACESRIPM